MFAAELPLCDLQEGSNLLAIWVGDPRLLRQFLHARPVAPLRGLTCLIEEMLCQPLETVSYQFSPRISAAHLIISAESDCVEQHYVSVIPSIPAGLALAER